jgi:leucyl-tRNA synthetase
MVRDMQTNWIGRSEGGHVVFTTEQGDPLEVFTTRPDTLWGATFMVIAPEHPLVAKLTSPAQAAAVEAYVAEATRQTDIQRESTEKEKTGVFTGSYAVNPVNGAQIPVWIADYVLMTYGTGAIMAVPAHDQRDFEFAKRYGLDIALVVQPAGTSLTDGAALSEAWPGDGVMVNSGPIDGLPAGKGDGQSVKAAIAWLEARGLGRKAVTYRLRDWLISRQRYWGAPIPIVYCRQCGVKPVPLDQLPVELPEDVEWRPTGQSPLKLHPTWKDTTCPTCGGPAERDTDTMDTFMCSSWYHLRYLSPHYGSGPFDPAEYDYWMPVDTYTGGAEHATMHLIYTRFFHKASRTMEITAEPEPMTQLRNQGQILGPDGQRMSKSRGNVIDPDEQVRKYGADTVRAYLMFGYRWADGGPWNTENIQGVVRWLHRVWSLVVEPGPAGSPSPEEVRALRRATHQTIARVSEDFERFEFNTIVAALMEYTNTLYRVRTACEGSAAWDEAVTSLLLLAAPVAPHVTEELWARLGRPYSIHQQPWPAFDAEAARDDTVEVVVQVNGKPRDKVVLAPAATEAEALAAAMASARVTQLLGGATPNRVIYVPGRLLNLVV